MKDEAYVLGLDLGTNSIGWAVVGSLNGQPAAVLSAGSHVFTAAGEDSFTKKERILRSAERRRHRSARKTNRRKKWRRHALYQILAEANLLPTDPQDRAQMLCCHRAQGVELHPYALRARAVDAALPPELFARALCHINQRRGYLSTRDLMSQGIPREYLLAHLQTELEQEPEAKDQAKLADEGMVAKAVRQADEEMRARGLRTFGQLMNQLSSEGVAARLYADRKKGKPPRQVQALLVRPNRAMLEEEFEIIWERQAAAYPDVWTPRLKERVARIIFYQRKLESAEGLRQRCPVYPSRKRSPKASEAFQRAAAVQRLVQIEVGPVGASKNSRSKKAAREASQLSLAGQADGMDAFAPRRLTTAEMERLLEILMQGTDIPFAAVPQILNWPDGLEVKLTAAQRKATDASIRGNRAVATLRSTLGESLYETLTPEQRNEIMRLRICVPGGAKRYEKYQAEFGFEPKMAASLALMDLGAGYGELSTKALNKLSHLMLHERLQHKQAFDELERKMKEKAAKKLEERGLKVFPDHDLVSESVQDLLRLPAKYNLRNPVVERAIRRMVWVVNQIVHRYGPPATIRVEMPRELSLSFKKKMEIFDAQMENKRERDKARKVLREHGVTPTDTNVKKYRLAVECDWRLPYEPWEEPFTIADLESLEIDHILPRARRWDNSWRNVVLSTRRFNMAVKGKKTPFETYRGDPARWAQVQAYIASLGKRRQMPKHKVDWLLREEHDEQEFSNEQLVSTGYIARQARALLTTLGAEVTVSKGKMTSDLRRMWELNGLLNRWLEEAQKLKEQRAVAKGKEKPRNPKSEDDDYGADDRPQIDTKSRDDHRHHAIDAIVIALTTPGVGMRITKAYQAQPDQNAKVNLAFTSPIPNLRKVVADLLQDMPVTHDHDTVPHGGLHDQMPKREKLEPVAHLTGHPWENRRVEGVLVRFDGQGKPFAAYPLGSNHHLQILRAKEPNRKGEHEIKCRVVSTFEAVDRKTKAMPIFEIEPSESAFEVALNLCGGDCVEWTGDFPGFYRLASMSDDPHLYLTLSKLFLGTAAQEAFNVVLFGDQPGLRIQSSQRVRHIARKVVLNLFGEVVHSVPNLAHRSE